MEVDTGSATSIVSWNTVKQLVPRISKRQLKPCSLLLRDYKGSPIPIVGSGKFKAQFKKFSGWLSLGVVDDSLPSLLGLNWSEALGLTIHGINSIRSNELESFIKEFPAVFDG